MTISPALLIAALERGGVAPRTSDILVVTRRSSRRRKGAISIWRRVEPSRRVRRELARDTGKDPRLVEAILAESRRGASAPSRNVLIVATRHGLVLANAGIDQSNLETEDHGRRVLLLPEDPDRQCAAHQASGSMRISARHRRDHLRQRRPGLAARHGRARHRRGRRAALLGPARRDGSGRAPAGGHRSRLCRCGCGRGRAGHGRGRRRLARCAGARPRHGAHRRGRPRRWCGRGTRTCSDEAAPAAASTMLRCGAAVGGAKLSLGLAHLLGDAAHRRRQHRRRFRASRPAHLARCRHALYTLGGRGQSGDAAGAGATKPGTSCTPSTALGGPAWFSLGDRDLATHVDRTAAPRSRRNSDRHHRSSGRRTLGVAAAFCRWRDEPVRTVVETDAGTLAFQEYFVRDQCRPVVRGIRFDGRGYRSCRVAGDAGTNRARPRGVIICPSNPWLSIDPILAVPGMRERDARAAALP